MKTKLFVGNLNFDTTDEQLRRLFEPYGQIESVTVVTDKRSGRSKGYGFVQMVESKDAAKALEISGQEFMGRDIVVTEADSQTDGEGGRGRRPRSGGRHHGHPRNQNRGQGSRNHGSSGGAKSNEKQSWWKKLTGIFSFGKKTETTAARSYDNSQSYPRQHRSRNRRNRRYRGGGRGGRPSSGGPQGHGAPDRSTSGQSTAPTQN